MTSAKRPHMRAALWPSGTLWRGPATRDWAVACPFPPWAAVAACSVEYEHMFAFGHQKSAAPRSRELPIGLADRVRPTTPVAGRLLPVPAPLAPLFPDRGAAAGDDDHGGRAARPWRHHVGVGVAGRGIAGRELVCRGRPARSGGGGGSRVGHRPASGGLRAPSGEWMGRGGGRPVARRRRRPGTPARPGPPDGGPPSECPGPGAPGGAGRAGRPRQRVARRR